MEILRGRVFPLEISPQNQKAQKFTPVRFGSIELQNLRPEHLDWLTNALRSLKWHRSLPIRAQEIGGHPLSPRRMNIILLRVRQVLDLAYERGYLEKNPHYWITLQEEEFPDIDPFSFEERAMFLKALPDERWRRYFIVAFDTGCRPSEQLALAWSNVDFERRKIFIRKGLVRGRETNLKTKKSRRDTDMLPTIEQALREQLAAAQGRSVYVFPNANGRPLDLANLRNRIWYPTLQRAGLRPRDLYQTRHTFASLMLQAGEDPAWVARMMGHTTTRMLYERYGKFIRHWTRQDGAEYLKKLREAGGERGKPSLNRP